ALTEAARSTNQSQLVRRRALESVAVFGEAADVDSLIEEAYGHDDIATRASAVFAMGRTYDRKWLPILIAEFESNDPELRFEAARASGEIGHDDAVIGLSTLIKDEDTDVRQAAITALGAIGSQSAIRVLRRHVDNCMPGDEELVLDALAEAEMLADALSDL